MAIADPRHVSAAEKQPGLGKTFPVQIGQDTYGVLAQTDPLKARFWQSILGRAKTAGTPVHCLCPGDDRARLLSVHERDGRYHLQAYPNQGESHAMECRFHRDASGPKNAFPETTDEPAQDEPPRDRLPMGFAIPTHSPSMGGAGAGGPRNSQRINRVSLEFLLIKLRIPMKPATVSNRMSAIISSANSATHSIRNPAIHSNPKSATDSNGWPAAGGFWFSRYTK